MSNSYIIVDDPKQPTRYWAWGALHESPSSHKNGEWVTDRALAYIYDEAQRNRTILPYGGVWLLVNRPTETECDNGTCRHDVCPAQEGREVSEKDSSAPAPELPPLSAKSCLVDLRAWIDFALQAVKYRAGEIPPTFTDGYSYVEAPEWAMRQKLDNIRTTLTSIADTPGNISRSLPDPSCACGDIFNENFKGTCPNCIASDYVPRSVSVIADEMYEALKALDARSEEEDGYDHCEPWTERRQAQAAIKRYEDSKK